MWRGLTMNFSMNTRSSPNEDFASERARAKPSATSLASNGDAHALAAAAGRGLDHHRIADLVGDLHRVLGVLDHAEMAGHGRDLGRGGGLLAISILSPIAAMALGLGPMKTMPAFSSATGKRLALGQEAVARMHRLGAGLPAGLDDLVDHADRTAAAGGGPMCDGLVGHLDMQRVAVGVGIDRDRLDAHPARGLDDAAGDLAAVGDQDFLEHAVLRAWAFQAGFLAACGTAKPDRGNGISAPIGLRCPELNDPKSLPGAQPE